MTDLDRDVDIEIHRGFARLTVRIPLEGHASQEWLSAYQSLAHKRLVHQQHALHAAPEYPIQAEDKTDRTWVVVRLPAGLERAEVQSVLTIARESIAEADAAEQVPQATETEAIVREWWARQHG